MPEPLRIALISQHASPLACTEAGGVAADGRSVYVAQVGRQLARLGHQVDVLTRRDDAALQTEVHMCPKLRVIHIDAGPPIPLRATQRLRHVPDFTHASERLLRNSLRHDIVHANGYMSGMVAQRLQQALALPFVMTFHALGLVAPPRDPNGDADLAERVEIEHALVRCANAVVAQSPQERDDLTRLYGARPSKLLTVPCGYDPEEFSPMSRLLARQHLGLAAHEFVVLHVGRLDPRKGIDHVIRALSRLPQGMPVRLLVVGGESRDASEAATPERERLQQLAQQAGVAARISFTGPRPRDELRRCYAAADVLVTAPSHEPFGITPIEAMACGTPVVGCAVGGLRSSVEDGVTGFLVPPGDADALAQRLANLHANPFLAESMGRAGLRRVRAMFTWAQVASELADVYQGVRSRCAYDPPALPRPPALRLVPGLPAGAH